MTAVTATAGLWRFTVAVAERVRNAVTGSMKATAHEPSRAATGRTLDSRTRIPHPPDMAVNRTALVNQLRTQAAPVVLVTAPAGYGKSTLLAQWASRDQRPFAWVHVDETDSTADLARMIVEAIDPVENSFELDPAANHFSVFELVVQSPVIHRLQYQLLNSILCSIQMDH